MRRAIAAYIVGVLFAGALVVPVRAGSLMGTFDGDATLTPTGTAGVYTENFTGEGDDNTYGSFTPSTTSTINFSNPPNITVTDVMFSAVFSQGSLFGTGSGSGTGNGNGTGTFTADILFTGGTGLFLDATGSLTLTGTLTLTGPTTIAVSDGSYVGSFSAVPEPGPLGMLAPALVFGSIVVARARRPKVTRNRG
jgi:hypothetical protein